jgi:hypothetical protein
MGATQMKQLTDYLDYLGCAAARQQAVLDFLNDEIMPKCVLRIFQNCWLLSFAS